MADRKKPQTIGEAKKYLETALGDAKLASYIAQRFGELKLTALTKQAIEKTAEQLCGKKADINCEDEYILEKLYSFIVPGGEYKTDAKTLLKRFGSLAGVVGAKDRGLFAFDMTYGEGMRLIMLAAICLWSGKRRVSIVNRASAIDYLDIYKGGDFSQIACFLDDGFINISTEDANFIEGNDAIPPRAVELGAKNIILSAVCKNIDERIFALADRIEKIKSDLARSNVNLIDCIIFNENGYASLGPSAFSEGSVSFEFIQTSD